MNKKFPLRQMVVDLADAVINLRDSLQRHGHTEDNPEGSRYVKVSETLLNDLADLAKKIKEY